MNKQEKQFKKEYLEEKLHLIGDRLNDAYGQPLLEELINRMEKTVFHFNEEVDSILERMEFNLCEIPSGSTLSRK